MKQTRLFSLLTLLTVTAATNSWAENQQYTYAWPYAADSEMKPRGGTTKGTNLVLEDKVSEAFSLLQSTTLSKLEKDHLAILAMAGAYRASFDFIETAGFALPSKHQRPYQSWGTEYIYIVVDKPKSISLQHVLVMSVQLEDGTTSDPYVIKHWRQDWTYEDRNMHTYQGNNTWEKETLSKRDAQGTWTQAVYQVDDSPRYESMGKWIHLPNHSSWQSGETWRPLPRREFSVRSDYDVLVGKNRHTITPLGWIHEEDNLKVKISSKGEIASVVAREAGLNRYERTLDFDFSAGDEYWSRTQDFWRDVSNAWEKIYKSKQRFSIVNKNKTNSLIGEMFEYADSIESPYDTDHGQQFIQNTLGRYIKQEAAQ